MEKKQLDFNAPFLSVRRLSSMLEPSNPDTRALYQNALPNGRHNLFSVKSDFNLEQVTEPVAVPFLWEHIPGRAKSKSGPQPQLRPLEESSDSPRHPPGKVWDILPLPSNKELEYQNSSLTKLESSKEGVNGKGASDWENDDDAYSDALETLSPASFSLSCSVSGLSGSDGLDVKPSGTFSTDPQTRDFMLRRFLPAAKAMTLEPPHYVSRKQSMVLAQEQPREVKKMVSEDRKPLLKEYESRTILYFEQGKGEEESESEDDDYDDGSPIASAQSCGFLPRFCLKNSLGLLNPVPAMKHSTHSPKASTSEVRKQRKSFSGPLSQNIDKHASNAIDKHKVDYGAKNKQTGKSNHVSYSGELQTTNRSSSPYGNSRGGGISPYRNEAPVSPLHPATGFLGVPKEAGNFKANISNMKTKGSDSFQQVLSQQRKERGSMSVSPTVEKTLYIIEYSKSRSNTSDTKGKMDYASKNFDSLAESREAETTPESSFQDISSLNVLKGSSISKPKIYRLRNADPSSYSDISHLKGQAETMETFRVDQGLDQESRSLVCLNVNRDQNIKEDTLKNSHVSSLQSTLTPPLPKSPSESWLWRTLPSVPSRNPSPHSRKLAPTTSSIGTKWENIVKTSFLHHDHVRYSEELVANVRKQSRP